MKKDITHLIEQDEQLEQRLEISLSGIFASEDEDGDVSVKGEIKSTVGDYLTSDITLHIAIYDAADRIVGTSADYFEKETFFRFAVFDLFTSASNVQVHKIKLFPSL